MPREGAGPPLRQRGVSSGGGYFAAVARDYERFRPRYPEALFELLVTRAPAALLACDCASGNAQAALPLTRHFATVIATDASIEQLAAASAAPAMYRVVAAAEQLPLAASSADLVTVAQGLHWLDLPAFYAEARRILKPAGVLAVWTYNMCEIAPAIDALIGDFYRHTVGKYWTAERALVDEAYASVELPFAAAETVCLPMSARWDLAHLLAYLGTWSAVTRFRRAEGRDPVAEFAPRLAQQWGEEGARAVRWRLTIKLGRR